MFDCSVRQASCSRCFRIFSLLASAYLFRRRTSFFCSFNSSCVHMICYYRLCSAHCFAFLCTSFHVLVLLPLFFCAVLMSSCNHMGLPGGLFITIISHGSNMLHSSCLQVCWMSTLLAPFSTVLRCSINLGTLYIYLRYLFFCPVRVEKGFRQSFSDIPYGQV